MLTSLAGLWVGFGVAAGLLLCLIVYRAVIGITEDFPLFRVRKMLDLVFRQRATEKLRGSKGLIIFAALAVVSPASAAAITASGALTRVDSGSTNVCLQNLSSFTPNSGIDPGLALHSSYRTHKFGGLRYSGDSALKTPRSNGPR